MCVGGRGHIAGAPTPNPPQTRCSPPGSTRVSGRASALLGVAGLSLATHRPLLCGGPPLTHCGVSLPQVRVWSMDSVLDDSDDTKPRLLATLTDHFGSVNVVRFSPDGRLLASGSDDKAILIYKLEPTSAGAPPRGNFGSSDPPPLENWKLCQTLKVRGFFFFGFYVSCCSAQLLGLRHRRLQRSISWARPTETHTSASQNSLTGETRLLLFLIDNRDSR